MTGWRNAAVLGAIERYSLRIGRRGLHLHKLEKEIRGAHTIRAAIGEQLLK